MDNLKQEIIEFLILNQSFLKKELEQLTYTKNALLLQEPPVFREDLEAQYDARIMQRIAFYTADRMAIPAEYVIIELEKIDLKEFLDV